MTGAVDPCLLSPDFKCTRIFDTWSVSCGIILRKGVQGMNKGKGLPVWAEVGCRSLGLQPRQSFSGAAPVSGEESVEQIGSRAERMGLMDNGSIYLFSETRLEVCTRSLARPPTCPPTHSPLH